MHSYVKAHQEMLYSSIWSEDSDTRIIWLTMLLLKSPADHVVKANVDGLAHAARVSVEKVERALGKFLGPDPKSRSREFEGRRIEVVDGGWRILNGEKYAHLMGPEDRREYLRRKQAEYRKRKKELAREAKMAGAQQAINEGLAR